MKPTKLSRQDVLRRARDIGLKFHIGQRGDQWVVTATSAGAAQPIVLGAKDTFEEARAFVAEKTKQMEAMLPSVLDQARNTETGIDQ